jgi:hypothetical protein
MASTTTASPLAPQLPRLLPLLPASRRRAASWHAVLLLSSLPFLLLPRCQRSAAPLLCMLCSLLRQLLLLPGVKLPPRHHEGGARLAAAAGF